MSEGTYRFFVQDGPRQHVPFAYAGNKLFVCHQDHYDHYHGAALRLADDHPDLEMSRTFHKLRKQGIHWVDQTLLGRTCCIF